MKKIIIKILKKIKSYLQTANRTETLLLNQGKILEELYSTKRAKKLSDFEWGVFSQWGEDGIIQFLIREVEIKNKTFVEFGVEHYYESNTRYLLMSSDWQGFVIDSSNENINSLKNSFFYWKHDLQSKAAFIDKENINELLLQSNFDRDLGILSIDIDGNDYHILKVIDVFEPRIIISEFNPYFGAERAITIPYDPKFHRTDKHYSNLYFGASLKAIEHLLKEKGYTLIGTGMTGGNAYFVKNDLITEKLSKLAINAINFNGHCRESRDVYGKLNYLRGEDRLKEIKGLPVLNVLTGTDEFL